MVAIVDYGMGNLRSLVNAVRYLGCDAVITSEPRVINDAARLILPGVGAFGEAMNAIRTRGLDDVLDRVVRQKGKPVLGICLGMQLMARSSEEHGVHVGLAWLDAAVVRFSSTDGLKIPHVGWNEIILRRPHHLFSGLKPHEQCFYFVHSYHMACADPADVVATCRYGLDFAAVVERDNILATQFHPEKSQDNGLQLLTSFLNWKA